MISERSGERKSPHAMTYKVAKVKHTCHIQKERPHMQPLVNIALARG